MLPLNILVEGETDKRYLEAIANTLNIPTPNTISAGSATKVVGQIQFFNSLAEDLEFKPVVRVVLDNDDEGRKAYQHLNKNIAKDMCKNLDIEL